MAVKDGEEPAPYEQSEASVAVHLVDVSGDSGRRVVGWTLTRGGSARSTSEPAARSALELHEGRMEILGVKAPEAAIPDPDAFLALLDTDVYWEVA